MRRSRANMSGSCAYAIFTRCCAICRMQALGSSRVSAAGACADAHWSFHRLWLCVHKSVISYSFIARLYSILRQILELGRKALVLCSPVVVGNLCPVGSLRHSKLPFLLWYRKPNSSSGNLRNTLGLAFAKHACTSLSENGKPAQSLRRSSTSCLW
jgi:hypothetical protein